MRSMIRTLFVAALALGLSASDAMASAIAQIKAAEGQVEVLRNGRWRRAREGTELTIKDSIRTGVDALAQIEFYDADGESGAVATSVDLVPESEISIEHFEISKSLPRKRQGFIDMARGYLRAFTKGWSTGSIFSVKAGTTVCGIRGSEVDIGFNPTTGVAHFTSLSGDKFTFQLPKGMDPEAANQLAVSISLNIATNLAAGLPPTQGLRALAQQAQARGHISASEAAAVNRMVDASENPPPKGQPNPGFRPMTNGDMEKGFREAGKDKVIVTKLSKEQVAMLRTAAAGKAFQEFFHTGDHKYLFKTFENLEKAKETSETGTKRGFDECFGNTDCIDAILRAVSQELVSSPELNGPASKQ